MSTASPLPAFATCTLWKHRQLLKGQNVSQRLYSNATYEYTVGARNDRL